MGNLVPFLGQVLELLVSKNINVLKEAAFSRLALRHLTGIDFDVILEEVELIPGGAVGGGHFVGRGVESLLDALGAEMQGILDGAFRSEPLEAKIALGLPALFVAVLYH